MKISGLHPAAGHERRRKRLVRFSVGVAPESQTFFAKAEKGPNTGNARPCVPDGRRVGSWLAGLGRRICTTLAAISRDRGPYAGTIRSDRNKMDQRGRR